MVLKTLRGIVDSQFKGKKLGVAAIFFFLPSVLFILAQLLLGLQLNLGFLGTELLKQLVYLIAISIVLYILLLAFKGKAVSGKFTSIICAYSVTYLITTVFVALIMLVIALMVPGYFSAISGLDTSDSLAIAQSVSALSLPEGLAQIAFFAIIGILGLFAVFASLYVVHRTGRLVKETGRFSNLVFLFVYAGLSVLVSTGIQMLF
ncbi:MAG: hypothetical protein NUV67_05940 [archaeon]|nr:hypothetical protein [archaeon]